MTDAGSDAAWMRRAVELARSGLGSTYPNPCVGAVIVHAGEVVGEGRSAPTGGPHAEVQALAMAGARARGATLFVTLEPCCHVGRTGPCTDAVLEAGITRVAVGIIDPAAHARGAGITRLRSAGVEVEVGCLREACAAVHEHYVHHVEHGTPFVTLKIAASLDGRIATGSGDSKWITSEASRTLAHRMRAEHHAILVGVGTVLADDPRLDVRLVEGTDPVPIVLDTRLRLGAPETQRGLLRTGTIVVHTSAAPRSAMERLHMHGVETLELEADPEGRVRIDALLRALGARSIRSLLVEGGGRVHGSFVERRAWQRLALFTAPRILGEGTPAIAGVRWPTVADAPQLRVVERTAVDVDLLTIFEPG